MNPTVKGGDTAPAGPPMFSADFLRRSALALSALVYLRTITYDFIYDDHLQITLNPWLTTWAGLRHIFTQHSWAFAAADMPSRFYRPLYLFWLWLVHMPSDGAPGWFHLAAIVAHLAVIWLAFLLARRLLPDDGAAAMATVLFALHPAKIEAVAWIAGATEILHAAFFIAMFLAYFRWRESSRRPWLALSAACFAAALLAKETAVLGPALVLVYERMAAPPQSRLRALPHLARLASPFALVALAYWLIRMRVLGGAADLNGHLSWAKTAYTLPLALCWYLKHLVWPFPISAFYPLMVVRSPEPVRFAAALLFLLLLGLVFGVWARHSVALRFAGLWFAVTLLPAAAAVLLLQPHDRYLYLPSFAFAVIIAKLLSQVPRTCATVLVAGVAITYAATTFVEEQYWESDRQLFARAVEIAPDVPAAWELLAQSYAGLGDTQRALEVLQAACARMPQDPELAYALAGRYAAADDLQDAEIYFRHALLYSEGDHFLRGQALYQLGLLAQSEQRYADAESLLRQAISIAPNAMAIHDALARVLSAEGKNEDAAKELARVAQVRRAKWD